MSSHTFASTSWYETFFQGASVRLWDAAIPETATLAEVEYLCGQLNLQPESRILDAPCGNGRHATALARLGHRVTGVDISAEFLALAQGRSGDLDIEWIQADLSQWQATQQYDAAFCWGNSFGYLPHQKTVEWLNRTATALRPGGRFAIGQNATVEGAFRAYADKRTWYEMGGMLMLVENHFEFRESRLRTEFQFIEAGKTTRATSYQHLYSAGELVRLCEGAGFRVLELSSDLAGTPFDAGAQGLYLVASRE